MCIRDRFGYSVKVENEKEEGPNIKLNPYDQLPLHRKIIDKKNIVPTIPCSDKNSK